MRRKTRNFFVGNVGVGSDHPVTVQSMTTIPVTDVEGNIREINKLYEAGCDIIRLAFDKAKYAPYLKKIVSSSPIPVIADIQFDAASAIGAVKGNAAAVRLNPGLISDRKTLSEIAKAVLDNNVAVRVGANSGSIGTLEVNKLISEGKTPFEAMCDALVDGAIKQCSMLEEFGVRNIKVALKSSDVQITCAAVRKFAAVTDYPLHLGVTEAGTKFKGSIKSAVGIGSLLLDGIGDTIRVSLTAPPIEEIPVAVALLEAAGIRQAMPEVVSCPGCGRTEIELEKLVAEVEQLIASLKQKKITIAHSKIAVMGCPVNGPGEAKNADLGIAGSKGGETLILFKHGKVIGAYNAEEGMKRFAEELVTK